MSFRKYELGSYEEMCARAPLGGARALQHRARRVRQARRRTGSRWSGRTGRAHERRVSFGELQDLSNRFANVLEENGVERGDRVATLLPSLPETAAVFIGTYKRGAILLSMSVLYGDDGIQHRLRDSGAKALVTDAANRHRIPDGHGREGARDGRRGGGGRRGLRRRHGARERQLRDGRHRGRRPGPALLLVGHHRARPRASSTPTATCSPTRSSSSATTCATASCSTASGEWAWAAGIAPLLGPVALRRDGARVRAQGRLRPRGAAALPRQARRAEHVHHAHRAAGDDRRGGRGHALPARPSCASSARPASRSTPR